MALTAVFTARYSTSGLAESTYKVRVTLGENYNSATNKSTLSLTSVEFQRVGNSTNFGSLPVFGTVKVNGTTMATLNGGSTTRVSISGSGWAAVNLSGISKTSVSVSHDADGSGRFTLALVGGFSYSGSNYFCANYQEQPLGVPATSTTVNLTTRPRISSVSATDAYIGEPVTITLNRYNAAFTHTVKATCAGNTETLLTKGSTYPTLTWTPALATYAPLITNAMTATATITCETYNGDTLIGQSTTTCTLTLKAADVAPTLALATADPEGHLTTYGKYVKSKSKITVTLTPTLKYGASLAATSISANGEQFTASPATTNYIASASNTAVSASIQDSRGQTANASGTIQIYDYDPPAINGFSAHRCNQDGTENNAGAYFTVTYDINVAPLGNHNSKTLTVKYKKLAASTYSSQVFTPPAYSTTGTTTPIAVDTNSTYNIQLVLEDDFATGQSAATAELVLPTAETRMNWGAGINGGVAIGKVSEYDKTLELADGWSVKGKGFIDLIYPVGSIYMSVNSTSPATLFGGTWSQIEDTFLLAAGQTYSAGATGGEAAHTLTTDEMPAHSHDIKLTNSNLASGSNYARISSTGSWGSNLISSAGGGQAHNNMPPYLAVYVWKRTA